MSAKYSKNFILLFITAVIWGVAFVAQSAGMDYVGPYTFNAVRCLLGGIVLIPCVFFLTRSAKKEQKKDGTASKMPVMDRPKDLLIGGLICGFMMFVSTPYSRWELPTQLWQKQVSSLLFTLLLYPFWGFF